MKNFFLCFGLLGATLAFVSTTQAMNPGQIAKLAEFAAESAELERLGFPITAANIKMVAEARSAQTYAEVHRVFERYHPESLKKILQKGIHADKEWAKIGGEYEKSGGLHLVADDEFLAERIKVRQRLIDRLSKQKAPSVAELKAASKALATSTPGDRALIYGELGRQFKYDLDFVQMASPAKARVSYGELKPYPADELVVAGERGVSGGRISQSTLGLLNPKARANIIKRGDALLEKMGVEFSFADLANMPLQGSLDKVKWARESGRSVVVKDSVHGTHFRITPGRMDTYVEMLRDVPQAEKAKFAKNIDELESLLNTKPALADREIHLQENLGTLNDMVHD